MRSNSSPLLSTGIVFSKTEKSAFAFRQSRLVLIRASWFFFFFSSPFSLSHLSLCSGLTRKSKLAEAWNLAAAGPDPLPGLHGLILKRKTERGRGAGLRCPVPAQPGAAFQVVLLTRQREDWGSLETSCSRAQVSCSAAVGSRKRTSGPEDPR